MHRAEYDGGMTHLMMVFDKRIKGELADFIYERVKHFDRRDWLVALQDMIEDPERRMIPRMGEIIQALSMALSNRIRREDNQRKLDEREAFRKLAEHPELEGIGLILQRLPFPEALRAALSDKLDGKITQSQLDQICRDWTPPEIGGRCLCDDGFVSYKKNGMCYTGSCAACGTGQIKPKRFPRVDPKTLQVISWPKEPRQITGRVEGN